MRVTAVLAGIVSLLAALSLLGWAMRPFQHRRASAHAASEAHSESSTTAKNAQQPEQPPSEETPPEVNPFTLSREGRQPKVDIDTTTYNFGRLAVGATGQHEFVIRNVGEATLKLAQGPRTCKCTVGKLGTDEVPPGGTATIHMEWDPPHETSSFLQTATIWTNDPEHPKLELKVEGSVVPLIRTIPEGTWTVGVLSDGQQTKVKGTIVSFLKDSFDITSIETSSDHVQVTYRPLEEHELQRFDGLSGYELTCAVSSEMPVGAFNERVRVHLSLEEAPLVSLEVRGTRVGPFQVIGPGWAQEQQLLRMGRCRAADGKKVQISLFVTAPTGQAVEFGTPEVTPPVIDVTVRRDESFSTATGRYRFLVELAVPPGITPARWQGDSAIKVVLPCTHPEVPSSTFMVELQAD